MPCKNPQHWLTFKFWKLFDLTVFPISDKSVLNSPAQREKYGITNRQTTLLLVDFPALGAVLHKRPKGKFNPAGPCMNDLRQAIIDSLDSCATDNTDIRKIKAGSRTN